MFSIAHSRRPERSHVRDLSTADRVDRLQTDSPRSVPSAGAGSDRSSSAIRFNAARRNPCASRAISRSPARSSWGTRRSSAATSSSRSRRMVSCGVIFMMCSQGRRCHRARRPRCARYSSSSHHSVRLRPRVALFKSGQKTGLLSFAATRSGATAHADRAAVGCHSRSGRTPCNASTSKHSLPCWWFGRRVTCRRDMHRALRLPAAIGVGCTRVVPLRCEMCFGQGAVLPSADD